MTLKIEFETENAAFEEFRDEEIKQILHEIAARIEQGSESGSIHDTNGARVGQYELTAGGAQ